MEIDEDGPWRKRREAQRRAFRGLNYTLCVVDVAALRLVATAFVYSGQVYIVRCLYVYIHVGLSYYKITRVGDAAPRGAVASSCIYIYNIFPQLYADPISGSRRNLQRVYIYTRAESTTAKIHNACT